MGDPLEITRPPDGYRCDAHEAFTVKVENRITKLETKVDATTDAIRGLETTQRNLVREIQSQMRDISIREQSQNGHIADLTAAQKSRAKLSHTTIQIIKILAPIIMAIITAGGAASWVISCNGQPDHDKQAVERTE